MNRSPYNLLLWGPSCYTAHVWMFNAFLMHVRIRLFVPKKSVILTPSMQRPVTSTAQAGSGGVLEWKIRWWEIVKCIHTQKRDKTGSKRKVLTDGMITLSTECEDGASAPARWVQCKPARAISLAHTHTHTDFTVMRPRPAGQRDSRSNLSPALICVLKLLGCHPPFHSDTVDDIRWYIPPSISSYLQTRWGWTNTDCNLFHYSTIWI